MEWSGVESGVEWSGVVSENISHAYDPVTSLLLNRNSPLQILRKAMIGCLAMWEKFPRKVVFFWRTSLIRAMPELKPSFAIDVFP